MYKRDNSTPPFQQGTLPTKVGTIVSIDPPFLPAMLKGDTLMMSTDISAYLKMVRMYDDYTFETKEELIFQPSKIQGFLYITNSTVSNNQLVKLKQIIGLR